MKNENWYFVCDKKAKVALDYMQLPEVWGNTTGLSSASDEDLKSLVWAGMPDIAFLQYADAVAAKINKASIEEKRALCRPFFEKFITEKVQERLDSFAETRNYDSILSATTYATSLVPKFAAEGQYAVEMRDATWAALYTILQEVDAGTRSAPNSYADIEPFLPELTWPA